MPKYTPGQMLLYLTIGILVLFAVYYFVNNKSRSHAQPPAQQGTEDQLAQEIIDYLEKTHLPSLPDLPPKKDILEAVNYMKKKYCPKPVPVASPSPEVFLIEGSTYPDKSPSDIAEVCAMNSYNAVPATLNQLKITQSLGADWCRAGAVGDDPVNFYWPSSAVSTGCGGKIGLIGPTPITTWNGSWGWNCFGTRPPKGTTGVLPFNGISGQWSIYGGPLQYSGSPATQSSSGPTVPTGSPSSGPTVPAASSSEVFMVVDKNVAPGTDSVSLCANFSASVATVANVQAAANAGASWCAAGTVSDDSEYAYWPNQAADCSSIGLNSQYIKQGDALATAGVNCYGIRPPQGTSNVIAFNGYPDQNRWSQFDTSSGPTVPTSSGQTGQTPTDTTSQPDNEEVFTMAGLSSYYPYGAAQGSIDSCNSYGAKVATKQQLDDAAKSGASVCKDSLYADDPNSTYVVQNRNASTSVSCSRLGANNSASSYTFPSTGADSVWCYGTKPDQSSVPLFSTGLSLTPKAVTYWNDNPDTKQWSKFKSV